MTFSSSDLSDLADLFVRFAVVDGVSLHERQIADTVAAVLRPCGVRVVEDGTAAAIGGTAGNLLCFPPDFRTDQPAIMLTAHLDTVESTANLKPLVTEERISSDGNTILGGDNRLGLAILTYLLQRVATRAFPHRNFFVAHTVAEEIGLFGAEKIDLSPYRVNGAYVFDSSRSPGVYVRECVGLHLFEATFHGRSAHAGVAPEEGINAIALAARALTTMQIGRIDPTMTTNVGWISGGGATNVVPDRVTIKGEVRSFSEQRSRDRLQEIEQGFRGSLNGQGSVDFSSQVDFAPYVLAPDAPLLAPLERAIRTQGLQVRPIRYTGGSDANKYNAKGIPAVNLGIGAQKPHTHEEFVLRADMAAAAGIAFELIQPD